MELLAFLTEDLVSILLTATHALQFGKVFSRGEHFFQLHMLFLVGLELNADALKGNGPLILQVVVLFETVTYVSLVVLVVLGDLRFALLEHLNFKSTLPWPLLSKVLIKFFD